MIESLRQQIISADNIGIIIFLVVLALICLACLYAIFRYFHRSRIIDDTATSKIRSAHQGFVELEGVGRLMKGMPIVSPLSNMQCLWYSYSVERKVKEYDIGHDNSHGLSKSHWEKVDSGVSDNLFLLIDETGTCVVDPEEATISPSFSKTWYGSQEFNLSNTNSADAIMALSTSSSRFFANNNYKYTEKRINVGADLYVLGRFKTIGGRREKLDKAGEVRDLIAKWKTRPEFLLARFDENGDGEIDMQEWQKVMSMADQEVENSFTERLVQPEIHTVSKPVDSRRPFIISVESQETIANKYRWYSRAGMVGFFLSGITFVWTIGIRLTVSA